MLVTLLGILVGAALVFSCLTHLFAVYETVNNPAGMARYRDGRDLLRPGNLCLGVFTAIPSVVFALVAYPLKPWRGLGRVCGDPRGPAILLVHGLYHNASAWLLFSRRLRRAGYRDIHTWAYSSFQGGYGAVLERFKEAVARVAASSDGRGVVLIGHSLGGVLIRGLLADATASASIRAVVTLGSPHHGSKLAALAVGELGRELLPPGPLASLGPAPLGLPKLCLYSPLDSLVLPASSLLVDEPGWSQEATPVMSHLSLLYDSRVARRAVNFLDKEVGHAR